MCGYGCGHGDEVAGFNGKVMLNVGDWQWGHLGVHVVWI